MKKALVLSCFLAIVSLDLHASQISFKLKNLLTDSVLLRIEFKKPFTDQVQELEVLYLAPGAAVQTEKFTVDKHSTVTAYCILKEGGRLKLNEMMIDQKRHFGIPITVAKDVFKPVEKPNVTLLSAGEKLLEFDTTLFLDPSDYSPKNISPLFTQYLGGIVALKDTLINGIPRKLILDWVDASELKMNMKTRALGSAQQERKIYFKSGGGVNFTAQAPGIANANFNLNNESLYEAEIVYKGCGVISWEKPSDTSVSVNFIKLPDATHYRLAKCAAKNPGVQIRQVDRAYVIDGIYYELNEYSKSGSNLDVGVSSFVTGAGNYSNEKKRTEKIILGSVFLGFWCSLVSPDLTALLDYSKGRMLAVNLNIFNSLEDNGVIVAQYEQLRKEFSDLPKLTNRTEIIQTLTNDLSVLVSRNPDFKDQAGLAVKRNVKSPLEGTPENKIHDMFEAYLHKHPEFVLPESLKVTEKAQILNKVQQASEM